MAVISKFIGINKYESKDVRDLTGAVNDATALWALFTDSLAEIDSELIVDENATYQKTRQALILTLLNATKNDDLVLTFSGHGTKSHTLLVSDTDTSDLLSTTISLEEFADAFKKSEARTILCVLDACFSGGAPAKVLHNSPITKSGAFTQKLIAGKGKVLLSASGFDEPAYEHPQLLHGFFTHAIIQTLLNTHKAIGIASFAEEIQSRVRATANSMGVVQNPVNFNMVEGGYSIPVITPGQRYFAAFPEKHIEKITSEIDNLSIYRLPQLAINTWRTKYPKGLNELQVRAINEYQLLNGNSLLVIAPTSSGKTFLGELASIKALSEGKKAVFLFPYKALVNEKFEDFAATYSDDLDARVIRCTGDYSDNTIDFLNGKYEFAILTYEMFLGLLVNNPSILHQIGLIVLDEAQFITDPERGNIVELILTRLRLAKETGISPQLLALSASIGNINNFDEWLGCECLITRERPVPLERGVLDRSGLFESITEDGVYRKTQLLPPESIVQRKNKPSIQDLMIPLVKKLISEDEKETVLVFRNTRGITQGCAQYLAEELNLPTGNRPPLVLSILDGSSSSTALQKCIGNGIAFHNTNLTAEERSSIEQEFRMPNSSLRAMVATSTLAAGVNTPASTVVIGETRYSWNDQDFTVAEINNMAGRAGRLGFQETGRAILLAATSFEREYLFRKYIDADPEPIVSTFSPEDLSTWLLSLVAQVDTVEAEDVSKLISNTYGGYLIARGNPDWLQNLTPIVEEKIDRMLSTQLLEYLGTKLRVTALGKACAASAISVESCLLFLETISDSPTVAISAFKLVGAVQFLPELDSLYTPLAAQGFIDKNWPNLAEAQYGTDVVEILGRQSSYPNDIFKRAKRACLLIDWLNGKPIADIEADYSKHASFYRVEAGNIRGIAEGTRFRLRPLMEILKIAFPANSPKPEEMEAVLKRLEFGVPEKNISLLNLPFKLNRGEYLKLLALGVSTDEEFWAIDHTELSSEFSKITAAKMLRARETRNEKKV